MDGSYSFGVGDVTVGVDKGIPGYDKTGVVVVKNEGRKMVVLFAAVGGTVEEMIEGSTLEMREQILDAIRKSQSKQIEPHWYSKFRRWMKDARKED